MPIDFTAAAECGAYGFAAFASLQATAPRTCSRPRRPCRTPQDLTLSYPDHSSSVPSSALYVLVFVLPAVVFAVTAAIKRHCGLVDWCVCVCMCVCVMHVPFNQLPHVPRVAPIRPEICGRALGQQRSTTHSACACGGRWSRAPLRRGLRLVGCCGVGERRVGALVPYTCLTPKVEPLHCAVRSPAFGAVQGALMLLHKRRLDPTVVTAFARPSSRHHAALSIAEGFALTTGQPSVLGVRTTGAASLSTDGLCSARGYGSGIFGIGHMGHGRIASPWPAAWGMGSCQG